MAVTESYKQRIAQFENEVTVYPVSCEPLANGRTDVEWLEGVLEGGARVVQLRDKVSDDRTFFQKAEVFREMTRKAGALFIVNNRVDIALLSEADGVHLGNSDLLAEEVRKLAPELIIGVSCNSKEQVDSVQERRASYYNIGPLFPTATKKNLSQFVGTRSIPVFSSRSSLPYTVMGGIKLEHVAQLIALGVRRLAVVTALTKADNIAAETARWVEAIEKAQRQ